MIPIRSSSWTKKWLRERVLHIYAKENFDKFKHNGPKIIQVRENNDQFPDLYCTLEDGREVPAEVEWHSNNFVGHHHDASVLRDNQGFLIVCKKDQEIGFDLPQYLIDLDDFEKWFAANSTGSYKILSSHTDPPGECWDSQALVHSSFIERTRSDAFRHRPEERDVGRQEHYGPAIINQVSTIQPDDLIAFMGPARGFAGRVDRKTWTKKGFRGSFEKFRLYGITKGYFFESKALWPVKGKWLGETFPHRFGFDLEPVLELGRIKVNQLTLLSKNDLHDMICTNFAQVSPSTLLDIMYHAER